jgi:hypothetical protein
VERDHSGPLGLILERIIIPISITTTAAAAATVIVVVVAILNVCFCM